MGEDIKQYARSCPTCQMMKSDNQKQTRLLQPIPIPTKRWQQITTDLVTDLPKSQRPTAITIFVDHLSKMVHFAPCKKEVMAKECTRIFVDTMFCYHGMSEVIISN